MSDHSASAVAPRGATAGRSPRHRHARALLFILLVAPSSVLAQRGEAGDSRFTVEPRFGVWWARLEDSESFAYSDSPGWFSALHLTAAMTPRVRWVASVGYARLDDASVETTVRPNGDVLTATDRLEIIPVTAGVELDLTRGKTIFGIGLEAGAAWSRSPVTSRTGPPPFFTEGDELSKAWGVGFAVLPSITARRVMSSGLGVSFNLQSFWDEGTFEKGDFLLAPVASFGISWPIR